MRNKASGLFFCFLCFALNAYSQGEYLIDIDYNLDLIKNTPQLELKSSRSAHKQYFIIDTLNLPFVDDFSVDRFTYYYLPIYLADQTADSVAVNFKIDGNIVDSLKYIETVSWDYTYDSITNEIDSTAKPSFQLSFYEEGPFPNNPFIPSKIITAWPAYSRAYINSQNELDYAFVPFKVLILDTIVNKVAFVSAKNSLWLDNDVYINTSFAISPPTIGVVTFDGLSSNGSAYAPGQVLAHGIADHLTSKPIFLNFPASDSLYFSFYYQPQGIGNMPESNDSLVLEFYSPLDSLWKRIWSAKGEANHVFKQVLIPIMQQGFLQDGFQFRFKNYANLSGNLDHWNLDYVRLEKGLNAHVNPEDVAFVSPANTILKNFREMPWKQFVANPGNEMASDITVNLNNLSSIGKVINYTYNIKDRSGNTLLTNTSAGSESPNTNFTYSNTPGFIFPINNNLYEEFEISNSIYSVIDVNRSNDTIRHLQRFDNYYAYDDGVPESGFGLNKMGAKLAYKFTLNTLDTLTAVAMHFTPVNSNVQYAPFKLTVWSNLNPETILYQDDNFSYPGTAGNINGFNEYVLSTPLVASGIIYVGWVQVNATELNIGFDKNNNQKDKIFYNLNGNWQNTQFNGSLLMRPVFGVSRDPSVGIDEPFQNASNEEKLITIFPNPANNHLFFDGISDYSHTRINIFDMYGKNVFIHENQELTFIDVSGFSNGIYIVKIDNSLTGKSQSQKIIISN
ncbi:MAG: T9SS type A sorting domain-containing protein [Bacteroidetes bacterium]|nr:T9SS type A sorting domain-containing protein [Bacteroidota bacterium]HET6244005.1 T9SS type A sorting domain-containing protein [Bacteroidia bacterium]